MKIGILKTGHVPDELVTKHGNYADMFVRVLGQASPALSFAVYPVHDHELPESADECDGWVITGSRYGVYEDHGWIDALKDLIRDIHQQQIPLFGICFGHQIVAEALGGSAVKSDKGWGLGYDTYTLIDPPAWLGHDNDQLTLHIVHQDQVVACPPDAKVFATSPFCEFAGLRYGDSVVTIQAHPEFSTEYNQDILQIRRGVTIPVAVADPALEMLKDAGNKLDSQRFIGWMADFFLQAHTESLAKSA